MLATSRHSFSQSWNSDMSKWTCNTFSAPKPATKHCFISLPRFHPGGNAYGLKDTATTSTSWYQPNVWVTMSCCACTQASVCSCTWQQQDADLTKIHLKPTGKTSPDSGGLWLRAVTELYLSPKCSLHFLKFLAVFTLQEKKVSKSKVYHPGCAQENKEALPLTQPNSV